MEAKASKTQIDLMRHTVGLDREGLPYRNYFSTDKGGKDFEHLKDLVGSGLMYKRKSPFSSDYVFHLTDKGCKFIGLSGLKDIPK